MGSAGRECSLRVHPVAELFEARRIRLQEGSIVVAGIAGYSGAMAVFGRVVVGVDGTDWGFEALRQALALAPAEIARRGRHGARYKPGGTHRLRGRALGGHAQRGSQRGPRHGRDHPERSCHSSARVVTGIPLHVLRKARDEADATLLALGARHSSRFLGIMLGDTASELVHDGACSVLLARPQREGTWQPQRIVLGLDGSAPALAALATADELASRVGTTVEVVCATSGGSRVDGAWTDRVDSWDAAQPVAALVERSRGADLVVGSRGLHGLRALGSVSERVAHRAHCSVLVVHDG